MSTPSEVVNAELTGEQGDVDKGPLPELPRGHPRDDVYNAIAERHRQRVASEFEDAVPEPEPDEQTAAETEAAPKAPAEPEADTEPEAASADAEREPEPDTVWIEVYANDPDGFRGHVPRVDIDAAGGTEAYGKRLAADIRARRAEAKEQAVAVREAEVARREAAVAATAREQPAPAVLNAEQQAELDKLAEDYPDEFVDTRRRVLEMQHRQQALDPNAIAQQVLEATRQQNLIEAQERADKWFSEHYAHVERDPDLLAIAERKAREILQADAQADPQEVVRLAGEHADQFARRNQTASDSAEADARVERKRQLSGQPTAQSVRRAPEPEPPPPTSSDVIREMRKLRGQPV